MFTVKGISPEGITTIIEGYKVKKRRDMNSFPAPIWVEVYDRYSPDDWFFCFKVEDNEYRGVVSEDERIPGDVCDTVVVENSAGKTTEVIRAEK